MKENWNLKDLFKTENELEKTIQETQQQSKAFKQNYENKLETLSYQDFEKAIKEYESLLIKLGKIMTYAYLNFASDTSKGSFLAKCENECKQSEENLLFFELEFCELNETKSKEFAARLKEYSFYLNNLLKNKKHKLSQKEERIILNLSNTGAQAFSRLFDESLARLKIPFENELLSEEEILSKMSNADRKVRKKAAKAFSKVLEKNAPLLTYIYNMIKTERASICKLRGFKNAEESRHLSNQISQNSVDALINCTEKNFDLVSQFYKKKKQILGFKTLKDYDRYAPIGKDISMEFSEAKSIVLKAFKNFSPTFFDIANEAFEKEWIDIYPKEGKRGGAFSHSATPDTHPYVLLNYTKKRRDLFTLAHELGHTIHQKLSYNVSYLNQDTPLTTAETASVFAEMLVFDLLKKELKKDELIGLYAAKIEDIFATLYRQINFTTFERRIHAHEDELSTEKINEIWMQESKKMFQDSVILGKRYASWWSYIPHFIHSPFYCYAYAYAQLLVLALYGLYKSKKCENFTQLYIKILSLGGSKDPKELIGMFGFDIEDKHFWDIGIKEIKKLVDEFMELE
ncbi:oligoendopeptidase F [Campylobacter sp. MIT 12-8780]|uniref:M3 family oligoendopeptidase n=1 Tax=unclassified Campylobacter TaxID=2593542 RepID=UPI00115D4AB6|nr:MULTISPECIES: M3 family oligoendopeptidase [unclassified Campylobacter]NDJ26636.1 M3 family oligoendopeptidase [Campylobacter sp. MIT 19-121]TQR42534.1 oligoendopeptidase F [Campylobacter sp. MIT 12-8780]